jgi:hypothetical protein
MIERLLIFNACTLINLLTFKPKVGKYTIPFYL